MDLGTGTGVLPRNLYRYGAEWTEHMEMLDRIAPQEFDILHYAAMAELTRKPEIAKQPLIP